MSIPTIGIGFSPTTPAPTDPLDQLAVPQGDNGTPLEKFSFTPKKATSSLRGTVKPDGQTTSVDVSGNLSAIIGGTSAKTGNYTALAADNQTLLSFADSSPVTAHTLTLPAAPPFAKWKISVQNTGAAVLTVNRNGLLLDGVAANLTLNQGQGLEISTDGTNYFTERGVATAAYVSPLTTKGDLFGRSTVDVRIPVGADGQSLVADSTQTPGVRWSDRVSTAGITIDGGGSTPATGSKGFLQVPFAGTITGWTLIADVSGSASITVKKSTFAGFPTNSSIVTSAPPALSSQQNATSSTLTGWTTAVAAGDVLEFVLASATTVTRLTLELQIKRS